MYYKYSLQSKNKILEVEIFSMVHSKLKKYYCFQAIVTFALRKVVYI